MDDEITIEQIAAEMDELGRTKLELAIARVQGRRQARRIAELENAQQPRAENSRRIVGDRAVSEGGYMPPLDPDRHPTIPGEDGSPVEVPS